ncbi:MAG: hypothetical protein QGG14_06355 [Planctomycetota bacterium]|jgi:hypothetical protein|nr:hypothetical protein [Planctomycetota bacterium]
MLEKEESEIDGNVYRYQPLKLKPARALFDRVVQSFGPAIANALEGLKDAEELDEDMDVTVALGALSGSFAGMLRGVVDGLDERTHAKLADDFAKQLEVEVPLDPNEPDGERAFMPLESMREQLFGRRLLTEGKVIVFCLRAQFEDFLEPVQRIAMQATALRAKVVSSSSSRKESTGSRTVSPQAVGTPTA